MLATERTRPAEFQRNPFVSAEEKPRLCPSCVNWTVVLNNPSVTWYYCCRGLPYLLFRRKQLCSSCCISLKEITRDLSTFWDLVNDHQWTEIVLTSALSSQMLWLNLTQLSNTTCQMIINHQSKFRLFVMKEHLYYLFVPYLKKFFQIY